MTSTQPRTAPHGYISRPPYIEEPLGIATEAHVPHLVRLFHPHKPPVVDSRDPDGTLQLSSALQPGEPAGWALHLPWEKNPTPMNRNGARGGWRTEAGHIRMVRETARVLALRRIPPQDRIRVRLDWEVIDRRDRDEDNVVKCMKHLVDGLRLAMVIPKDTREYCLRDMPHINYAPRSPTRPVAFMRLWIWSPTD